MDTIIMLLSILVGAIITAPVAYAMGMRRANLRSCSSFDTFRKHNIVIRTRTRVYAMQKAGAHHGN